MKTFIGSICAAAVIATSLGAATVPANAASPVASTPQTLQVADRGHAKKPQAKFYKRGGYAYYNGHRGSSKYHPGYRRYNGYWFPPAAFIIGGIIGGLMFHAFN